MAAGAASDAHWPSIRLCSGGRRSQDCANQRQVVLQLTSFPCHTLHDDQIGRFGSAESAQMNGNVGFFRVLLIGHLVAKVGNTLLQLPCDEFSTKLESRL